MIIQGSLLTSHFLQNLCLYMMLVVTDIHRTWFLSQTSFNRPSVARSPVLTTKIRVYHRKEGSIEEEHHYIPKELPSRGDFLKMAQV